MTKGERLVQRYYGKLDLDMDMDKEGAMRNVRGSKILGQEKHTSRGSKLMNLVVLHLICAYSCACLHCISF